MTCRDALRIGRISHPRSAPEGGCVGRDFLTSILLRALTLIGVLALAELEVCRQDTPRQLLYRRTGGLRLLRAILRRNHDQKTSDRQTARLEEQRSHTPVAPSLHQS